MTFAIQIATLVVLIGTSSFAQSRGGSMGHVGGSLGHAAMPTHAVPIRPGARVGTPLNPNFAPIGTVPGLNFNIQALAEADRRNARRSRRNEAASPFVWYSPYSTPYFDYDDQPQPPYDYSYAPPQPAYPPPAQPAEAIPAPSPSAEPSEPQPPPRDVGQFVLVRLDGQTVFASAFMAVNGRVTYVTREGIRRSFPISELDKDATRQMNEANGTSISLPN